MKKIKIFVVILSCIALLFSLTGCFAKQEPKEEVGIWKTLYELINFVSDMTEYDDVQSGIQEDIQSDVQPDSVPVCSISTVCYTSEYGLAGTYTDLEDVKKAMGDMVTLVATVNDGYNFEGWFKNDVCVSKDLQCEYVITENRATIEARYSYYTISTFSVTDEHSVVGTFTELNDKKVSVGDMVELEAEPQENCIFVGWFRDNVCVSTDLNYSFEMPAENLNIEARFTYYTLTVKGEIMRSIYHYEFSYDAGTFTRYDNQKVLVGEDITLTASTKAGYVFVGWFTPYIGVDRFCLCDDLEYTFTMTDTNVEIHAVFQMILE